MGQGDTDRRTVVPRQPMTVLIRGQIIGQKTGVARRLGKPVAMADRNVKPCLEARRGVFQQGTCAADASPKAIEFVRCQILIRVQEKFEQGRHHADERDFFTVQESPKCSCLELSVQHDAALAIEGSHQRHDGSIDMVDRKHTHQPILGSQAVPCGDSVGINEKIVGSEYDALRRSGCAGGIDNQGLVIQVRDMRTPTGGDKHLVLPTFCPLSFLLTESLVRHRDDMMQSRQLWLKTPNFLEIIRPTTDRHGL